MEGSPKILLSGTSRSRELLQKSYDIVGDIAVVRVSKDLEPQIQKISETILLTQKHIKTVLRQISPVNGDFRLRELEWVAGENKTETVYREFGCLFRVDLARCYFSPRLSYERMRIARLVQPNESIINMFAGVGTYSVIIAKHSRPEKVYSIDINPTAIKFLTENARINRVEKQVYPILDDARRIIETKLQKTADRIIMPLPEKAYEYLDTALLALKRAGGFVHYYDFEHSTKGEDVLQKVSKKVAQKMETLEINYQISSSRIVRTTGPNWHQVVIDIRVT